MHRKIILFFIISIFLSGDIKWYYLQKLFYPINVLHYFLSDEFFVQNFKHLRQVNYLGGEPLIIDEHYEFLRKCIKFNVAMRIILSYTTNLTVIKEE